MEDIEKLKTNKQKEIISVIVKHLSESNNNLYYEPTINLCREIHHTISNTQRISVHEKEFVKDLTPEDIQTLLSYASNCC
jgi:hypothetical protein